MKIKALLAVLAVISAGFAQSAAAAGKALSIQSPEFVDGGTLPASYTCDSVPIVEMLPVLSWGNVPRNVKSFALTISDPDAGRSGFYHLGLYNLPPRMRRLEKDIVDIEGWPIVRNDAGYDSYYPPCPPEGSTRHYVFTLYALKARLTVRAGTKVSALVSRLRRGTIKHLVLQKASTTVNYTGQSMNEGRCSWQGGMWSCLSVDNGPLQCSCQAG